MLDGGLRRLFRTNMPELHWQAIETGGVGLGVPDSNYVHGWVEFKTTQHWRAGLRPEQAAWLGRRARAGGKVFVAVRRRNDELWIFDGSKADALLTTPMHEVEALLVMNRPWDWQAVRKCLVSGL